MDTSAWRSESKLTAKSPRLSINVSSLDLDWRQMRISGGDIETEAKLETVVACAKPSTSVLTATTPDTQWARACRKSSCARSSAMGDVVHTEWSDREHKVDPQAKDRRIEPRMGYLLPLLSFAGVRMSASTDPDALLVAAMAAGDRVALARLYDAHAGPLLALGARMLGSEHEAEDLVHDVLIEAWRGASTYDPTRGTVRTWLSMRLRSRAFDRLRSRARSLLVESTDESRAQATTVPDEDPALSPDRHRLHRVLATLPEAQRVVLELGYFEGLSSSEISERVQVPIGTVKSRVAAALSHLRAIFGSPGSMGGV